MVGIFRGIWEATVGEILTQNHAVSVGGRRPRPGSRRGGVVFPFCLVRVVSDDPSVQRTVVVEVPS